MLTDNSWLEVDEDCPWDMFSCASLAEEGVEGVVTASNGLVRWHLTIRLDTVLQTVQLPACIAHLDTCLANVDGDTFPLKTGEAILSYKVWNCAHILE
jgi:hypothetical protein